MALNEGHEFARRLNEPVASTVVAGNPVQVGKRVGVAQTNAVSSDGVNYFATVDYLGGYQLSVKAIDDNGNSDVSYGDVLYFTAADTPQISKKASGTPCGFARVESSEGVLIAGGATATIEVVLFPSIQGVADIAPGSVIASMLASGAVTAPKIATGIFASALIAGGAAGDHAVTGMVATDEILMVLEFTTAASIATATMLTSEFTAGTGKMNNTGGTDTTNNQLLVIFMHHA